MVVCIFSIITSGCKGAPSSQDLTGFLHAEGSKVVNSEGNVVFLRGIDLDPFPFWSFKEIPDSPYSTEEINEFNHALFTRYITEEDFQTLSNMGVNVIRKQVSFYALETAPYQYNDAVLQQIDHLVELGARYGIYVVFSLTDAAQNTKQQDNQLHYDGNPYLWTDEEWRKRVVAAWEYMAKRYADNPTIAGYDVINEPTAPSKADLHTFYSDIISTIRNVDNNHIIILERQQFDAVENIFFGGQYNEDNLMLSFHYYEDFQEPVEECHLDAVYYSESELIDMVDNFLLLDEVANRPLYIGEFGAINLPCIEDESALKWTGDIMKVMNEHGIHYTYFSYKNIWGYWNPKSTVYYPLSPLFEGWGDQSIEMQIAYITTYIDDLLTSNWTYNDELRKIIIENL
jgi:hypothetical protein